MNNAYLRWVDYYCDMSRFVARKSKDPSTKVGAVITTADHRVLSTGYNGAPRGVKEVNDRPIKYKYYEHAERNAIYNAAYLGVRLEDSTIYVSTMFPCTDCARAIIQCGIAMVVLADGMNIPNHWKDDMEISRQMLAEAEVVVCYV